MSNLAVPTALAALDVDVGDGYRLYFVLIALQHCNVVCIARCSKTEIDLLLPLFDAMRINLQCHCKKQVFKNTGKVGLTT